VRTAAALGGLLLVHPAPIWDGIGLAVLIGAGLVYRSTRR
jgi:hypothetical protein